MRRIHRTTHEPRIEMTPLLDVIFLLLTFFIYALVLNVRAQVLPVQLPAVSSAELSTEARIAGISLDAQGALYLNRKPISEKELAQRLRQMARESSPPAVFLAMDVQVGSVDRGPLLVHLIDLLRSAGIEKFHIVGQPKDPQEAPSLPPVDETME